MAVTEVLQKSDFDMAIKKNKLVIAEFFARWCGPCRSMITRYEKLSNEYTSAKFVKIDVDEHPDLAASANIVAMPTFKIFIGGLLVDEVVGANANELRAKIEKNIPISNL